MHFDGFEKDTKPFLNSNLRREEQTTVGQPSGRPEDTQGTKEDQRRDGGRLIDRFVKHWHRVAQNVVQWRSVGRANVQRATFNG